MHAATALRILRALHEPDAMLTGVHPDDPSIPIQALNSEIFGAFTPGELAFFQIADATGSDALPGLEEILSGTKTNLAAHAVPIALSVLLKSSVALLVDRHGLSSSGPRIIWATAWTTTPDFADHLREDGFKPFHEDVFWKVNVEDDVIEVRYFAHGVLVYFWFLPKRNLLLEQQMIAALPQVDHFLFEGVSLLNLQTRRWRLVYQAEVPQRRNAECLCGSGVRFKHCHGAALTFR